VAPAVFGVARRDSSIQTKGNQLCRYPCVKDSSSAVELMEVDCTLAAVVVLTAALGRFAHTRWDIAKRRLVIVCVYLCRLETVPHLRRRWSSEQWWSRQRWASFHRWKTRAERPSPIVEYKAGPRELGRLGTKDW